MNNHMQKNKQTTIYMAPSVRLNWRLAATKCILMDYLLMSQGLTWCESKSVLA